MRLSASAAGALKEEQCLHWRCANIHPRYSLRWNLVLTGHVTVREARRQRNLQLRPSCTRAHAEVDSEAAEASADCPEDHFRAEASPLNFPGCTTGNAPLPAHGVSPQRLAGAHPCTQATLRDGQRVTFRRLGGETAEAVTDLLADSFSTAIGAREYRRAGRTPSTADCLVSGSMSPPVSAAPDVCASPSPPQEFSPKTNQHLRWRDARVAAASHIVPRLHAAGLRDCRRRRRQRWRRQ